MLLVLDDEHKKHMQFLVDLDQNVIAEFCRISMEFIIKGANHKVYQSAAEKLSVDSSLVQQGVEGLMYLFAESAKLLLNETDFQASVIALGFSESTQSEILQHYNEKVKDIRSVLLTMPMGLPHYSDLEWRCDVQIASRSLHHQIIPNTLLKLTVANKETENVKFLQSDITNLVHMTEVLDQALQEAKSQHSQRIKRHIK
ncbi:COMM domain-containing protein 2 [Chamberlinius hualienensis]